MDYFTKKRFVFWGVLLLTITNITMISTFWLQKHRIPGPPPRHEKKGQDRITHFLKNELELSLSQEKQFLPLQQAHFDRTKAIHDSIRSLKHELFSELSLTTSDTSKVVALSDAIGRKHARLEKIAFYHFLDLKALCTLKQQEKLSAIFHDVLRKMAPPERRPPPRRR